MADETYLFARFADRQKLTGVDEVLNSLSSVARWDAVDGYFGLAVRFTGQPENDIEKVRALEGLTEAVQSPVLAEKTAGAVDPELCQAYVLVEGDQKKIDSVQADIDGYNEVLNCARTQGQYSLVLVLQAATFDEIDDIIDDRISTLDGVLRLKEARIISSYVK